MEYNITIKRLRVTDINNSDVIGFKLGEEYRELSGSWKELLVILLVILNHVKRGKLLKGLNENKIYSNNWLITRDKVLSYNIKDKESYKIGDSGYYIVSDLKGREYVDIIKGLSKAIHIKLTDGVLYLRGKDGSSMEQYNKRIKKVVEDVKVQDIISGGIVGYKIEGYVYKDKRYRVSSNKQLIEELIGLSKGLEIEIPHKVSKEKLVELLKVIDENLGGEVKLSLIDVKWYISGV